MSLHRRQVKTNCCDATSRAAVSCLSVATIVVKKYGNRRLYDTTDSRYITLEELADRIPQGRRRQGARRQDRARYHPGHLAQIIIESRGAAKMLPVPLLLQLIRMREDALAEFMGRWMSWALAVYTQARQGARTDRRRTTRWPWRPSRRRMRWRAC